MYNRASSGGCCYCMYAPQCWLETARHCIWSKRRLIETKSLFQKAAGNLFSSMGSLFVCLRLFRGEWLHLFLAASICNLVCLSSESLAWGKQWHAPRVLEDHCVNGPRAARSEWRSLNTDTSCWTHQHELSEIGKRQPEAHRSRSELYQGKR